MDKKMNFIGISSILFVAMVATVAVGTGTIGGGWSFSGGNNYGSGGISRDVSIGVGRNGEFEGHSSIGFGGEYDGHSSVGGGGNGEINGHSSGGSEHKEAGGHTSVGAGSNDKIGGHSSGEGGINGQIGGHSSIGGGNNGESGGHSSGGGSGNRQSGGHSSAGVGGNGQSGGHSSGGGGGNGQSGGHSSGGGSGNRQSSGHSSAGVGGNGQSGGHSSTGGGSNGQSGRHSSAGGSSNGQSGGHSSGGGGGKGESGGHSSGGGGGNGQSGGHSSGGGGGKGQSGSHSSGGGGGNGQSGGHSSGGAGGNKKSGGHSSGGGGGNGQSGGHSSVGSDTNGQSGGHSSGGGGGHGQSGGHSSVGGGGKGQSGGHSSIGGGGKGQSGGHSSVDGGGKGQSGSHSSVGGGGNGKSDGQSSVGGGGNGQSDGHSSMGGGGKGQSGGHSSVGGNGKGQSDEQSLVGGGGNEQSGGHSSVGGGGNGQSGGHSSVGGGGKGQSGGHSSVGGGGNGQSGGHYSTGGGHTGKSNGHSSVGGSHSGESDSHSSGGGSYGGQSSGHSSVGGSYGGQSSSHSSIGGSNNGRYGSHRKAGPNPKSGGIGGQWSNGIGGQWSIGVGSNQGFGKIGGNQGFGNIGGSSSKFLGFSAASTIVQQICQPTDFKEACAQTLSAACGSITDPRELIRIVFTLTIKHISEAISNCSLLKKVEKDLRISDAIDNCHELLDDSIGDLQRSSERMLNIDLTKIAEHTHDLKTWLSGAITYQQTCLDGFENTTGNIGNEMRKILAFSGELTSNGLAIVTELTKIFSAFKFGGSINFGSSDQSKVLSSDLPGWSGSGQRRLISETTARVKADVVVAKDGSGKYKTIGEALNEVKKKSNSTFIIYVKAGVYEEYISINKSMRGVYLLGDGPTKTKITGSKSYVGGYNTFKTPTVAVSGDFFMAKDIGFENTAGPQNHQAVALRVSADRSVIYNCRIDGHQDTLYAHAHRQFYRDCTISGTIDFIFGDAAAVFQNCRLIVRKPLENQNCMVTAQGRKDRHGATGLVLQNCTVTGSPEYVAAHAKGGFKSFLGRPWKNYSRTIIMQSEIDTIIDPSGWAPWMGSVNLDTCWYAEFGNRGPGSSKDKRVMWRGIQNPMKDEAASFTAARFIDGDSWIPATGVPYVSGLISV